MPGPNPKHPSARARRNTSSTAATLSLVHNVKAPPLPEHPTGWHPQTLEWWKDIWASPMAPEFHQSDTHGLYLLALLVDEFWRSPTTALAAEIRLQRQGYGLTPMDRRRLQWTIEQVDEAVDKGEKRRAAAPPKKPAVDPRAVLRPA